MKERTNHHNVNTVVGEVLEAFRLLSQARDEADQILAEAHHNGDGARDMHRAMGEAAKYTEGPKKRYEEALKIAIAYQQKKVLSAADNTKLIMHIRNNGNANKWAVKRVNGNMTIVEAEVAASSTTQRPTPVADKAPIRYRNVDEEYEILYQTVTSARDTAYIMVTERNDTEGSNEELIKTLDEMRKVTEDALDRFLKRWPRHTSAGVNAQTMYDQEMSVFNAQYIALDRGRVLDFVAPEEWEELADDLEIDAEYEPKSVILDRLNDGVNLVHKFQEKVGMTMDANHPICNSSRQVTNTCMLLGAAKEAQVLADQGYFPAVVDVGSGSFGAQKMEMMKKDRRYCRVFFHAMMPYADEDDPERIRKIDGKKHGWNYVPDTKRIRLSTVNYCHHKCSECTCLDLYTSVHPIANHSLYHLRAEDYDNLFRKATSLRASVHIPHIGRTVPLQNPEYVWKDAETWEKAGMLRKLRAKCTRLLTGERQTVLEPLRGGGTLYEEPDIGPMLSNGGFHIHPIATAAAKLSDLSTAAKTIAIGAATAAAATFVQVNGGLTTRAAVAAVAGINSAVLTAGAIRAGNEIAKLEVPMYGTKHTIKTHITNVVLQTENGDPVAHVLRLRRCEPTMLRPVVVEHSVIDPERVCEAQVGLLAGGDNEKSVRQIHANFARKRTTANTAKHCVDHARRLVNFLLGPTTAPPPPDSFRRRVRACICFPFAWVASHVAAAMMRVGFESAMMKSGVQAFPMQSMSVIWGILPMVLLYPTFTMVMFVTGGLVAWLV